MKLLVTYSESHEEMADEWFLPSIQDEFQLMLHRSDVEGPGRYMDEDWTRAVVFKCERIIEAIRDNPGDARAVAGSQATD